MNREIKFRVWDIGLRMWINNIGMKKDNTLTSGTEKRFHVMQKTGLKDLNEIDIYEGDIVQCGYGIGEVIYHLGAFMIQWLSDKEADMEFIFSRKGRYIRTGDECLKVIGNIYQSDVHSIISEYQLTTLKK